MGTLLLHEGYGMGKNGLGGYSPEDIGDNRDFCYFIRVIWDLPFTVEVEETTGKLHQRRGECRPSAGGLKGEQYGTAVPAKELGMGLLYKGSQQDCHSRKADSEPLWQGGEDGSLQQGVFGTVPIFLLLSLSLYEIAGL